MARKRYRIKVGHTASNSKKKYVGDNYILPDGTKGTVIKSSHTKSDLGDDWEDLVVEYGILMSS